MARKIKATAAEEVLLTYAIGLSSAPELGRLLATLERDAAREDDPYHLRAIEKVREFACRCLSISEFCGVPEGIADVPLD